MDFYEQICGVLYWIFSSVIQFIDLIWLKFFFPCEKKCKLRSCVYVQDCNWSNLNELMMVLSHVGWNNNNEDNNNSIKKEILRTPPSEHGHSRCRCFHWTNLFVSLSREYQFILLRQFERYRNRFIHDCVQF